jgi:hypothetical protein
VPSHPADADAPAFGPVRNTFAHGIHHAGDFVARDARVDDARDGR